MNFRCGLMLSRQQLFLNSCTPVVGMASGSDSSNLENLVRGSNTRMLELPHKNTFLKTTCSYICTVGTRSHFVVNLHVPFAYLCPCSDISHTHVTILWRKYYCVQNKHILFRIVVAPRISLLVDSYDAVSSPNYYLKLSTVFFSSDFPSLSLARQVKDALPARSLKASSIYTFSFFFAKQVPWGQPF